MKGSVLLLKLQKALSASDLQKTESFVAEIYIFLSKILNIHMLRRTPGLKALTEHDHIQQQKMKLRKYRKNWYTLKVL